jgi:hypothetical protein
MEPSGASPGVDDGVAVKKERSLPTPERMTTATGGGAGAEGVIKAEQAPEAKPPLPSSGTELFSSPSKKKLGAALLGGSFLCVCRLFGGSLRVVVLAFLLVCFSSLRSSASSHFLVLVSWFFFVVSHFFSCSQFLCLMSYLLFCCFLFVISYF